MFTKEKIVSALHTLIATFIVAFGAALIELPSETWISAGWQSIAAGITLAAVRQAGKSLIAKYVTDK